MGKLYLLLSHSLYGRDGGWFAQARREREFGRLQLVIGNLSPRDAANFVCRATNLAGDDEAAAAVVVNCTSHTHTHTPAHPTDCATRPLNTLK